MTTEQTSKTRGLLRSHPDVTDPNVAAAATYEYHCTRCNTRSYVGPQGGVLNKGACDPCAGRDIEIHVILNGSRVYMGTPCDMCAGTCPQCESPNTTDAKQHDATSD